MANATFFSPAMPFAMRPDDPNRPARYHRGHLDTDWQKDLILPFQSNRRYKMPVEITDPFRFQVKSTPIVSNALQLVDCSGKFIYAFDITTTAGVAGDTTDDGTQFTTYHYTLTDWNDLTPDLGHQIPEGTYYIVYRVSYDGVAQTVFISEPIQIKAYHPDTVLWEYWHDSYKYGIPFSTIPAKFRKRIKGYVESFVPKSVSTAYQDQNSDTVTLDFSPYRAWRFYAGRGTRGTSGIADYELDKMNRILGCRHILIDGKAFTASTANPGWNVERSLAAPLITADVEIQEAVDSEDFMIADQSILLFTTGTYPYTLGHMKVGGFPITGATRIGSSGAETTAIPTWNTNASNAELTGSITKVGSGIYYNNGPGERYTAADIDVRRHTSFFGFTFTIVSLGSLSLGLGGSTGVLVWGDGSVEEYLQQAVTTKNHLYGSGGVYFVELWGPLQHFSSTQTGTSSLIGTLPSMLEVFIVQNMSFTSNTFNFAFLAPAAAVLRTLNMNLNGLVAANNMPSYNFPLLNSVQFAQNALPQTVMNLVIADVKNNAYAFSIFNGLLNVGSQVPPVTLNPTGTAAKTALQAYGWTVVN